VIGALLAHHAVVKCYGKRTERTQVFDIIDRHISYRSETRVNSNLG